MDDVQEIAKRAGELRAQGDLRGALAAYSDAFDVLSSEAHEHASVQPGVHIDIGRARAVTSRLFDEVKTYLKRDELAAIISNNMGSILADLNDFEGAKGMFEQAIDLTPDGVDYPDPKLGLKQLDLL